MRSGVRAVPKRTIEGAPPLLGKLPTGSHQPPTWLFTGLGARGFLYHALMAEKLAAAVLADDEALLPQTVRRWQR